MTIASGTREIEHRVLTVVQEVLAVDNGTARLDSTLNGDLGADSLDLLSLFMALQDEFGGTVSLDEAERMTTLRDVVEYITSRVETAALAE